MRRTGDRNLRLPVESIEEASHTANSHSGGLGDACQAELCRDVLTTLKRAGHKLCVLHGYEGLPEHFDSDIDAFSANPSEIPRILSEHNVATTVQVINHEIVAAYYVLCRRCNGKVSYLSLDVSPDYRRNGRIFFKSEDFFRESTPYKFFDVPPPELGFIFYLVKRLSKNALGEAQTRKLDGLYCKDAAGSDRQLARFFPPEEASFIAEAARRRDWEPVRAQAGRLRRAMLRKVGRDHPLQVIRYWLGESRRVVKRILQPTGLMVVFLGADGSGKSTVVGHAKRSLAPAFWGTVRFHLRPPLRRLRGKPSEESLRRVVAEPHAQPSRGRVASLAKLAYFWIAYSVGYASNVFPHLASSKLVLFDRYYHDILVDTKRYRYRGSVWPARLIGAYIPRPHLTILLDAPPEVLFARKQEVPLEEVTRQREEYLRLVRGMREGHVVDATKPLDEVVADVEDIVLGYMAARTARRVGVSQSA